MDLLVRFALQPGRAHAFLSRKDLGRIKPPRPSSGVFYCLCVSVPQWMDMKTIILPYRGSSVTVRYDDEDEATINLYSWYVHSRGYIAGSLRGAGARKAKAEYMHRVLMRPAEGLTVDHINADRADNRRVNLRCVPQYLNNLNQNNKVSRRNRTGLRGISLHKPSGLWQARVNINGKRHYLGYAKTPEEAAALYQKAIKEWCPAQCSTPRPPPLTPPAP